MLRSRGGGGAPSGAVVLRVARQHSLVIGECLVTCSHRHAAARWVVGVVEVHEGRSFPALSNDCVIAHRGVGKVNQLHSG